MNLHRLLFTSALVQGAGMLVTMLLGIQLARYLGPTDYGIYGLIMAVVAIAAVAAKFGLPLLAIREAARPNINFHGLIKWFAWRSAVLAIAVPLLIAAGFLLNSGRNGDRAEYVLLAAAFVALSALLSCSVGILRGAGHNLMGQIIELLLWPTIIVVIVYVLHADGEFTVNEALSGQIAALLASLAFSLVPLGLCARRHRSHGSPFAVPNWIATSATFMANNLLGVLSASYPMIVAGLFVAGSDLGILRVALASSILLSLPTSIANIATVPPVARELAAGDTEALARTLSHTTLACFALTALAWLFFAVFGRLIIELLFGSEYEGAYGPLLVLGIGHLIIAAFGIAGSYLNLTGRERLATKAFIISVPCGILVSLGSTKYVGIMGAAAGTVVMAAVWHLYVFGSRKRKVGAPLSLLAAVAYVRKSRI
jgi:O-antigen/teichoic acid export membrane protein